MKKTIQLKDLTCPSCVVKIEKGLGALSGVDSVKVRFNSSKVEIEYDEIETDIEEIQERIQTLGF